MLWVEDLIQAYDAFIKGTARHGVYNMGGGPENTMSLRELIAILADVTGKKVKVDFKEWRKFDQKVYVSDISEASRKLRWRPKVSPRQGVERIVAWLKENDRLFR